MTWDNHKYEWYVREYFYDVEAGSYEHPEVVLQNFTNQACEVVAIHPFTSESGRPGAKVVARRKYSTESTDWRVEQVFVDEQKVNGEVVEPGLIDHLLESSRDGWEVFSIQVHAATEDSPDTATVIYKNVLVFSRPLLELNADSDTVNIDSKIRRAAEYRLNTQPVNSEELK